MKKPKLIPVIVTSRESLEATVADVVRLKLDFATKTAAMETEIAAVQARHQTAILEVAREIDAKEAGVYVYCASNRASLFPEKKSLDLLLATIGFELNPPSIGKLASRDTWEAITARLAATPWGANYVVTPDPTISKSKLLADRETLTPEQLRTVGIKLEQDEQFFIRPKSDVAADTTVAA